MSHPLATARESVSAPVKAAPPSHTQRCWGLLTRRERWGLSLRGWLILVLTMAGAAVFVVWNVQPFLARTHRVPANVLVVEGWIHEYAIRAAVQEFKRGAYRQVFATGGPVVGTDGYTNDFNTAASVGGELLEKDGVPGDSLHIVPSHVAGRDRTYNSALALRRWMEQHDTGVRSINVLTEDVHARRTQLLFQEAFGGSVRVGIISIPDPDYDPRHWWRYSEGVREVLGETIAYIYAGIFFHPGKESSRAELPQG